MNAYSKAIDDYDTAIGIEPLNAEYYILRAAALYQKGWVYPGIADYTRALELSVSSDLKVIAYAGRGLTYYDVGRYLDAIMDYNAAIELEPLNSSLLVERARSEAGLARYDRALQDLTDSISLDPNNALARFYRGNIYALTEEYGSALADYNEALGLNPSLEEAFDARNLVLAIISSMPLTPIAPTSIPTPISPTSFFPVQSSLRISTDPHDDRGPKGVATYIYTLTNTRAHGYSDVYFIVMAVTGGNQVLNADGGPGRVGSNVTVGDIEAGETFEVVFEIGMVREDFVFRYLAIGTPRS